ncbi:MAG: hypothetical protein H0U49_12335 [Parachlamydiaceae bacterium]|nr:hypothetical protein [Parachlamydiaceae bacterium]
MIKQINCCASIVHIMLESPWQLGRTSPTSKLECSDILEGTMTISSYGTPDHQLS